MKNTGFKLVAITALKLCVIGALKLVYCLSKEEIPLTTKYEAIMDLAINLGCDYLKELEIGANARYRSHAIIGEFLKVLPTVCMILQRTPV